jgi:hypothetical protein
MTPMETSPFWLLTDSLGQTPVGGSTWLRWGRGVSHIVWNAVIHGYRTDSVHLPYLMDPMFERHGAGARLWLAEAGEPSFEDSLRVAAHSWTAMDEWNRPVWVDSKADRRVRLRFALLAAGAVHPSPSLGARLRTMSLEDPPAAVAQIERICADSRRLGRLPQAVCLAAMAVRAAWPEPDSFAHTMDVVSRHYPVYAWYAAMAAATACTNLQETAEEAVRWECRRAGIAAPVAEAVLV